MHVGFVVTAIPSQSFGQGLGSVIVLVLHLALVSSLSRWYPEMSEVVWFWV